MSDTTIFRFHVLSLPHTITIPEYNACAYTMKVLKFCKMMKKKGHYIIHYGHKDSIVECDEHVSLLDNSDLEIAYGSYDWKNNFFKHSTDDHCHIKFNKVGSVEIIKRIQKKDFVSYHCLRSDRHQRRRVRVAAGRTAGAAPRCGKTRF